MIPNRFEDYENFRMPKGFRIIETNPYKRLLLMHIALEEFIAANGEKEKWSNKMLSLGSVFLISTTSNAGFGILEGESDPLVAREEYSVVAYKEKKTIYKEKLKHSLFNSDNGCSNLMIHGDLNRHTSQLLLTAMKLVTS